MRTILLFTIIASLFSCSSPKTDTLYQYSTIDALLAAVYEGEKTCCDLMKQGDFGIGTFDCLDGEMILLNGKLYQVKSDGKVYRPALSTKTPFAAVCQFEAEAKVTIDQALNFEQFEKHLDKLFPNHNLFYAIKLEGTFQTMKTRSVPRQAKPIPELAEVAKHQPEFDLGQCRGTLVGFRCPAYVKGVNVPGYHLHFLTEDRRRGGHVLSFRLLEGTCVVDTLNGFSVDLPQESEAFSKSDLKQDRSHELEQVEKLRQD